MPEYKRNQIEEAISRVLEPSSEPSRELRIRLKRLLETDRALGRASRSTDAERACYAFFSSESPGSGAEVWFSGYEAFALLNALQLMRHGWTQSHSVSIMRQVRPELERQHARILKQDAKRLFDEGAIRQKARAGDMAFNNMDPVLLVIASTPGTAPAAGEALKCAVRRGPERATRFVSDVSRGAGAWTMFDVVGAAHKLAQELAHTEPRPRGRSG
jgi:hypothetical protein